MYVPNWAVIFKISENKRKIKIEPAQGIKIWGRLENQPHPHEQNISLNKIDVNKMRGEISKVEKHLSGNQKLLIQGLKLFGCSKMMALVILARLDNPEKVEAMLRYMVTNPESTPEGLYKVSSRILREE